MAPRSATLTGRAGAVARQSVATPFNTLLSAIVAAVAIAALVPLSRWALVDAVWTGTATDCRVVGAGACWAFISHKLRFITFGLYPPASTGRAGAATALLLAVVVLSAFPRCWRQWLLGVWVVTVTVAFWLMHGGAGLERVPTRLWGGLPVTLMLTTAGIALGFPVAILLALGRRSRRPVPRLVATAVVEVVRGIPLIAVLYVAALVVPLAMPNGLELDKLLLAQAGMVVFASAYLAEAVRAGLQMVPRGQRDAALALGLAPWSVERRIILPQALRIVVPSFVSIAVGLFQDTSLVVIVGLFDLLNSARVAAQDPAWLGFHTEAYAFVALVYFLGSTGVAQYGLWLERRLHRDRRPATA